ncbi:MAG: iron-containing alcohol dehydrogenase, partial [Acidobacteria bacterium]|nr:iron-containing alcohol dehydrogenase [Acidobacteriota bacterium]
MSRSWRLPTGPSPLVRSGSGALSDLGAAARERGVRRALITSDPGIAAAGITGRARASLEKAGVLVKV